MCKPSVIQILQYCLSYVLTDGQIYITKPLCVHFYLDIRRLSDYFVFGHMFLINKVSHRKFAADFRSLKNLYNAKIFVLNSKFYILEVILKNPLNIFEIIENNLARNIGIPITKTLNVLASFLSSAQYKTFF